MEIDQSICLSLSLQCLVEIIIRREVPTNNRYSVLKQIQFVSILLKKSGSPEALHKPLKVKLWLLERGNTIHFCKNGGPSERSSHSFLGREATFFLMYEV